MSDSTCVQTQDLLITIKCLLLSSLLLETLVTTETLQADLEKIGLQWVTPACRTPTELIHNAYRMPIMLS